MLDRPRSRWTVGAATETMVWSIKVIATARIIATRTRFLDLLGACSATEVVIAGAVVADMSNSYLVG